MISDYPKIIRSNPIYYAHMVLKSNWQNNAEKKQAYYPLEHENIQPNFLE